jgi:hypothetical protein
VLRALASRFHAVVAADAITRDVHMVEVRGYDNRRRYHRW